MHILTLQASPRTDGNTNRLLEWVERTLAEGKNSFERINLGALDIKGCRSCFACAESEDEPGCVLQDDAREVFRRMIGADAILFATPLYMWGYPSQLKALLDRSLCLERGFGGSEHRSFVQGKPSGLLVSCGGPVERNADAIQLMFPRFASYTKLDSRGVWVFPNCTHPANLPNTHGAMARELAASLIEGA